MDLLVAGKLIGANVVSVHTHNKNEELRSPPIHYSCSNERDCYFMIAANFSLFQIINALPIVLYPSRLNDGDRIEDTLRRYKARYNVQQQQARTRKKKNIQHQ